MADPSGQQKRITVDLDVDAHRWLKKAAVDADASMSDLVRAAVTLMEADPDLLARVTAEAYPQDSP